MTQPVLPNQYGGKAKRQNHTVPRGLLKHWMCEKDGDEGHWVLDVPTASISFWPGKKAKFAISEYQYVPVRTPTNAGPYRDQEVEDWFMVGETDLAIVIEGLVKGTPLTNTSKSFASFIQAAILLGYRSAYEYDVLGRDFASKHPNESPVEIAVRVVDAFKTTYSVKLQQFSNWDYQILTDQPEPLMICDRPLFDMTIHRSGTPVLEIPLTPSMLMVATPPQDPNRRGFTFQVLNHSAKKLTDLANKFTVERARQFVVGHPEQLRAVQHMFAPQKLADRMKTDRMLVVVGTFSQDAASQPAEIEKK